MKKRKQQKKEETAVGVQPVRYQADIVNGLTQGQVQERISGGWGNTSVKSESKTVDNMGTRHSSLLYGLST